MPKLLPLSDEERAGRLAFEDLTRDAQGNEVLWGLTYEESVEYLTLHQRSKNRGSNLDYSDRESERYFHLHDSFMSMRAKMIVEEQKAGRSDQSN